MATIMADIAISVAAAVIIIGMVLSVGTVGNGVDVSVVGLSSAPPTAMLLQSKTSPLLAQMNTVNPITLPGYVWFKYILTIQ
jgi:hypothetical protein